jgi:hypothetical protein
LIDCWQKEEAKLQAKRAKEENKQLKESLEESKVRGPSAP